MTSPRSTAVTLENDSSKRATEKMSHQLFYNCIKNTCFLVTSYNLRFLKRIKPDVSVDTNFTESFMLFTVVDSIRLTAKFWVRIFNFGAILIKKYFKHLSQIWRIHSLFISTLNSFCPIKKDGGADMLDSVPYLRPHFFSSHYQLFGSCCNPVGPRFRPNLDDVIAFFSFLTSDL